MRYFKALMKGIKAFFRTYAEPIAAVVGLIAIYVCVPVYFGVMMEMEEEGTSLNPNDYCNLTDVDYTAILHDDVDGSAKVSITEYLTFDVHAAHESNPFKELWRELPEQNVDGLDVTYNVLSVSQVLSNGAEIPYNNSGYMFWEDYEFTPYNTRLWYHSKGSGVYPDNYECLLIYIPWTYRDKLTFKIEYEMNNAALKYNDCSELYLSMYSGKTIKKLNSFKGKILIPENLMPDNENYYAYTFGTSNTRIPFTETEENGYHSFNFSLDKSQLKFKPHNQYIEFTLLAFGKDKHIFTKNAPPNLYTSEDCIQECIKENEYYENRVSIYRNIKIILLISSLIVTGFIINKTKEKLKNFKNSYDFYEPSVDYDYFREIPSDLDPLFASKLVFMKDPLFDDFGNEEEYAALLLNLARKKYVTISNNSDENKDWSSKNIIVTLTQFIDENELSSKYDILNFNNNEVNKQEIQNLEPLSSSEKLYLKLLLRHSRKYNFSISLDSFQKAISEDYNYMDSFIKNIENNAKLEIGLKENYFQQADYDLPKKKIKKLSLISFLLGILIFLINIGTYFTPIDLAFGSFIILGLAFIWRSAYFSLKSHEFVLLTQKGADEQAKWRGLFNFLNSDTLMKEKEIIELPLWEKYLVYATAFGISEKVIKAIKINAINVDLEKSSILNHNSFSTSHFYHVSMRSFGKSVHTISSFHGHYSSYGGHGGFGGHGGYGGGGRGGGGGGGGH